MVTTLAIHFHSIIKAPWTTTKVASIHTRQELQKNRVEHEVKVIKQKQWRRILTLFSFDKFQPGLSLGSLKPGMCWSLSINSLIYWSFSLRATLPTFSLRVLVNRYQQRWTPSHEYGDCVAFVLAWLSCCPPRKTWQAWSSYVPCHTISRSLDVVDLIQNENHIHPSPPPHQLILGVRRLAEHEICEQALLSG